MPRPQPPAQIAPVPSRSLSQSSAHKASASLFSRIMSFVGSVFFALSAVFSVFWLFGKRVHRAYAKKQVVRYPIVPLSPLTAHRLGVVRRKILVLDLDETLIHSHHDGVIRPMVKPGTPSDFTIKVVIDRHPVRFSVHERPHVDYFLSVVSQWFDLVIFTASMEVYGSHVADKLDRGRGILNRRYFRQHCTMDYGGYTKDLSAIHPDLSSIFILDNSPGAYRKFPREFKFLLNFFEKYALNENAIPIPSWFSDPHDTFLLNLLPFLDALRFVSDVRSVLSRNQTSHNQVCLSVRSSDELIFPYNGKGLGLRGGTTTSVTGKTKHPASIWMSRTNRQETMHRNGDMALTDWLHCGCDLVGEFRVISPAFICSPPFQSPSSPDWPLCFYAILNNPSIHPRIFDISQRENQHKTEDRKGKQNIANGIDETHTRNQKT
ncbi:hypothetical protein WR25_03891 [Diploscapter pachys]|uniref:CTD nuclear envelope phosphatase 1 homolog n=1 Tax=Diploscapter pachys TaxID=2018661 RepID=A0A2A2JMT5_9BILA|nr:hypothetical protein WR25_03891 [Diploscapter pachys]